MPRFYFDFREDGRLLTDDDGIDFPSLAFAARAAAEIVRDSLLLSRDRKLQEIAVEVRNESGEHVLSSTLTLNRRTDQN